MRQIITPDNNNGRDHIVGKHWAYEKAGTNPIRVVYCNLYDSQLGYHLVDKIGGHIGWTDGENIHSTYWEAVREGDYYWCAQWGRKVTIDGTNLPLYGEAGWTPRSNA